MKQIKSGVLTKMTYMQMHCFFKFLAPVNPRINSIILCILIGQKPMEYFTIKLTLIWTMIEFFSLHALVTMISLVGI